MAKIITNMVKCNHCGSVIESVYRHDFVWCSCKKVAVDGGTEYLRRVFSMPSDYTEMSKEDRTVEEAAAKKAKAASKKKGKK